MNEKFFSQMKLATKRGFASSALMANCYLAAQLNHCTYFTDPICLKTSISEMKPQLALAISFKTNS